MELGRKIWIFAGLILLVSPHFAAEPVNIRDNRCYEKHKNNDECKKCCVEDNKYISFYFESCRVNFKSNDSDLLDGQTKPRTRPGYCCVCKSKLGPDDPTLASAGKNERTIWKEQPEAAAAAKPADEPAKNLAAEPKIRPVNDRDKCYNESENRLCEICCVEDNGYKSSYFEPCRPRYKLYDNNPSRPLRKSNDNDLVGPIERGLFVKYCCVCKSERVPDDPYKLWKQLVTVPAKEQ